VRVLFIIFDVEIGCGGACWKGNNGISTGLTFDRLVFQKIFVKNISVKI
jgi:hypothetical protein